MTLRLKFVLIMAVPLALIYVVLNTMGFIELADTTLNEERQLAQLHVRLQADEASAYVRLARLRASGILAMAHAVDEIDDSKLRVYLRAAAQPDWIAGIGLLDRRQGNQHTTIVTGPNATAAVFTEPSADHISRRLTTLLNEALGAAPDGWYAPLEDAPHITPIFVVSDDASGLATAIAVDAEELTKLITTEDEVADPWVVVDAKGTVVLGHPLDAIGKSVHQLYPDVSDTDMERINARMTEQPSGYLEISTPQYWVGWATVEGSDWRLFLPIDMRLILTPVWAAVRQAAVIAVVGFVVNLLVIVLVAGLFTKPIRMLAAAFKQVRAGALDTRVPVKSRDELGHLAEGFNDMTSQLGGLIDARAKAKVERAAVERELSIAKEMQDSLLPPASSLPNNAVGRVQAKMQPAKEVGGDFFDAWEQKGSIWFTVADVSGKGVGAGLFMAVASTILHGVRKHVDDPGEALCALNDRLLEDGTDRPVFLTMFLGRLDPDGTVTFASAGHLPAIQLGTGEPRIVADATGPPLAMARDMVWTSGTLHMEPGEHLLLYSDGAVEAHYDDGTMVEIEGLAAMVQTALHDGGTDVIGGLVQTLTDLQTDGQFDDITLLSLTRRAT